MIEVLQSAVRCLTDCRTSDARPHPLQANAALPTDSAVQEREGYTELPRPWRVLGGSLETPFLYTACGKMHHYLTNFHHTMRFVNYLKTHSRHSVTDNVDMIYLQGSTKLCKQAVGLTEDPREKSKDTSL